MFLKRAVQQIHLQVFLIVAAALLAILRFFVFSDMSVTCPSLFPEPALPCLPLAGLSFLLLGVSVFFLHVFLRQRRLVENRKYYPLVLLPLFLSLFLRAGDWFALSFMVVFCGFFLPAVFSVYSKESYRQNAGVAVGMLCGCMGMFYAPLLLLLPFYYGLLFSQRLANFRSLLLPLAGLALWSLYVGVFCFLTDFHAVSIVRHLKSQWCCLSFRLPGVSRLVLLAWGLMLVLYVISTYRMIRTLYSKNILIRKKCVLLFFLSLFFLLLFLLSPYGNHIPLCGFAAILVAVLCEEESGLRNRFVYNVLFALCWILNLLMLC